MQRFQIDNIFLKSLPCSKKKKKTGMRKLFPSATFLIDTLCIVKCFRF